MMKLKQWLKEQRRECGLTNVQFAQEIGISRITLQRILAGGSVTDKRKKQIEKATDGAVPISAWYEPAPAE
jgi:DNA-binding XRE family transcriptional regulator